jgi:hypothetical protein
MNSDPCIASTKAAAKIQAETPNRLPGSAGGVKIPALTLKMIRLAVKYPERGAADPRSGTK